MLLSGLVLRSRKQISTQLKLMGGQLLRVVGEVHLTFTRGKYSFEFNGLVVEHMDGW